MAYISNILTHWVGRGKTKKEQYRILTQCILKQKQLLFGKCPLSSLSKHTEGNAICEMISFTDIPLSECEFHCINYSHFGISFKKAYLANLFATPVAYSQNPAFHGNIQYIFRTLVRLNEILIEKTGTPVFDLDKNEKGHTIHKNTLPLLNYILSYYEEYDKDNPFPFIANPGNINLTSQQELFFENTKAGYFEREWRIIPSTLANQQFPDLVTKQGEFQYLNFDEKYIQYIIMPKEFISQFNKESDDIFSGYAKNSIPSVLAFEDLKYI